MNNVLEQDIPEKIRKARGYFPRGLRQPEGSFRFSADALLLASFLPPPPGAYVLDLGTGCGVVALAVLCAQPDALATGVDREAELIAAARDNALALGFGNRFRPVCADLADNRLFSGEAHRDAQAGESSPLHSLAPGTYELVLANPPFRNPRAGRLPVHSLRRAALFETAQTLDIFCLAAAKALAPQGRFGIIYPPQRLEALLQALDRAGMAALRALPVHTAAGRETWRILLEAALKQPNGKHPAFYTEHPVILYENSDEGTRLSRDALHFCPWLFCNSGPG